MARIIAIANQKGGVGKTTTSINLSASLAKKNKKVLLIDLDPQGNSTSGVGIDKKNIEKSIYNVLIEDLPIEETLIETEMKKLFISPSNIQLAGAEVELVSVISRETRLKNQIEKIRDKYDYIIIDCPPSLGFLTINSLTAADAVLVPIQCEYYALEGLSQLMETVKLVQKHLNSELKVEGVLLTMYDSRLNLSLQVADEVRKHFKSRVFKTIIPRNVRLSEAPSYGVPVILYDSKSKGAECYLDLAKEVLKNSKEV